MSTTSDVEKANDSRKLPMGEKFYVHPGFAVKSTYGGVLTVGESTELLDGHVSWIRRSMETRSTGLAQT
jgi:hypothetical protein